MIIFIRPIALAFAALLSIVAVSSMALPLPAQADERPQPRIMTLSGTGEVTAAPDMAHVSTGVIAEAKTAREALSVNNKAMTKVIAELKARGIAEKDIQTSNFHVGPQYQHYKDGRPAKIRGYRVSNQVNIVIRELAKLGEVLDAVVSLGSNSINGVQFSISKPEKLRDEARRLAVADARRKAELYAQAAGVTLGQIMSINESGGFQPQPMQKFARAARLEAADAVPVQAGEQALSMTVNIAWEIK